MNRAVSVLASMMPTRWAFESLLLIEAEGRLNEKLPFNPTMPQQQSAAKELRQDANLKARDIAEGFFPKTSHRMGIWVGVFCLLGMLLLLSQAVLVILRARDIH